jgi:acyl dehydratase
MILSHDFKFTAPVFIGDTITGEAEVLSVHASKPVTQLKIAITRQTGETVLEGEAWCYTMSPEMSPGAAS